MDLQIVVFGDGSADGGENLIRLDGTTILTLNFHGNDQALLPDCLDREGGCRAGAQGRVRLLNGGLDVLGIEVAAPDDDQILDATRHEDLASVNVAQVSRAKKGAVVSAFDACAEGQRGLFRAIPVASGDAGSPDPKFADAAGGAAGAEIGIDNKDVGLWCYLPAAYEGDDIGGIGGRGNDLVLLEILGAGMQQSRAAAGGSAGDHQRRLGHAVAWQPGSGTEAVGGECLGEATKCFRTNRLGTVEGDGPGTQIEIPALLGRDRAEAELVGAVGTAGKGGPQLGDRPEPAGRPLQEGNRGHHVVPEA